MDKDNIVIEEGGMRYVMEQVVNSPECSSCKAVDGCTNGSVVHSICMAHHNDDMRSQKYRVVSATKIEPEPKMYFAWNREEAMHLVGKMVEHSGEYVDSEWKRGYLTGVIDSEGAYPLEVDNILRPIIREIPTIKLTRAELNEKYGVPDNVVIVEGI